MFVCFLNKNDVCLDVYASEFNVSWFWKWLFKFFRPHCLFWYVPIYLPPYQTICIYYEIKIKYITLVTHLSGQINIYFILNGARNICIKIQWKLNYFKETVSTLHPGAIFANKYFSARIHSESNSDLWFNIILGARGQRICRLLFWVKSWSNTAITGWGLHHPFFQDLTELKRI